MSAPDPTAARAPAAQRPAANEVVAAALLVAMLVAAGYAFRPVFPDVAVLPLVLPAAVGSVALSVALTRARGWSLSAVVLASTACGLVVATATTWRTPPLPADLGRTLRALPAAPERILTSAFPVPDDPELVILVPTVTWLAGLAAAELLLRARGPAGPLLVVAGGLVVGALMTGTHRTGFDAAPVAVMAVAAGALVLMGDPGRRPRRPDRPAFPGPAGDRPPTTVTAAARRLRRRRTATAVPLVLLAGLVPVAAADRLPWSADEPRFDLRDEPVGDAHRMRNPLVEVSAQRDDPETRELFVASAPDGVQYWRVMALDTFDGLRWTSSGTFVRSGGRLPPPPDEEIRGTRPDDSPFREVTVTVTLTDGEESPLFPFLPAVGRPVGVEGVTVGFDTTGVALRAVDHEPGQPLTYTVDALLADPDDDEFDFALRDRSGDDVAAATAPIDNAGLLIDVAMEQTAARSDAMTGSADIRQIRALLEFFADPDRFRLGYEPSSGLSLTHLSSFVATAVQGGPSEGSVEQFATSFAVMARTLGYPTRVAVGYYKPQPDADGLYRITNRDAYAWPEVKLEGLGWVPFRVGPVRTDESPPPEDLPETTTTTIDDDNGADDADGEHPDETAFLDEETESGSGRPWLVPLAVAAGTLLVVATFAPALARTVRNRRRARHPDVAVRIDGAWHRLLDGLTAHRVPVHRAMTATEVLELLETYFGKEPPDEAHTLATLANGARFSPASYPPDAADGAWDIAGTLLRWMRGQATWGDRLHAWFAVRSTT